MRKIAPVMLAPTSIALRRGRKDEVAQPVREQGEARFGIEFLEWEWLDASACSSGRRKSFGRITTAIPARE